MSETLSPKAQAVIPVMTATEAPMLVKGLIVISVETPATNGGTEFAIP